MVEIQELASSGVEPHLLGAGVGSVSPSAAARPPVAACFLLLLAAQVRTRAVLCYSSLAKEPHLPPAQSLYGQPTVGRMEPVDGSRFHRGLQKTAIRAECSLEAALRQEAVVVPSKSLLAAVPLSEAANF